jgi:hypothetical protein
MVAPGTRGAGRTVIEGAYPATPPPNEHYNSVGYLRKYNGPPTPVAATKLPPAALRAEADVAATVLASAAADAARTDVDTTAGPTVGAAPNAGAAVVRISAGDAGTDAERAILSSVLNGYESGINLAHNLSDPPSIGDIRR